LYSQVELASRSERVQLNELATSIEGAFAPLSAASKASTKDPAGLLASWSDPEAI
jgi:hypothetical protein